MEIYCLNLTRVDLDHSDPGSNQFLPKAVRKTTDGSFARAVDAPTCVGFSTSDRSNIDYIAASTTSMKNGKNLLGHLVDVSIGIQLGMKENLLH